MVAFTPGRTALLSPALLCLWGAQQRQAFLEDVAVFRAHALGFRQAAPVSPGLAAASAPPRQRAPAGGPGRPIVRLALPGESDVPPAYSTDSIIPLVYRRKPGDRDAPDALLLPPPAFDNRSLMALSWPAPGGAAAVPAFTVADIAPAAGAAVPLTLPAFPAPSRPRPAQPASAANDSNASDAATAAYAALAAGETERAVILFRQALDAAPNGQLAADLAYAALRLGRRREAAAAFHTALRLGAPTPAAQRQWQQDAARLNRKFSAQGYAFFRKDRGGPSFAPVGVAALGQSQSALAVHYRPEPLAERPLVLQARLLTAHDQRNGMPQRRTTQATAGLGWVVLPAIGGTLAAERWIGLGREARDAFAVRLYGGYGEGYGPARPGAPVWPHWSLFGEAAMVGARRRDLFAGGEARAGYGLALGEDARATLTAALWGMVQHDDRTRHRLEAGPSVGVESRLGPIPLHLRLDYRLPLSATPESGHSLALTVAAGF
ncbi:hypothetical protein [Pedomonas mirosovicensis]|uniref:hypothetical protein n=1 Tax=Pedomonas mirosovicensis TaxID=2908641 RepID=UPI00216AAB80|nr:hypothetical protein [Pedomonas mirosovicensis]MCH8684495.1 hypothetical protein [Pedomonas mirosovicensis]